MGGSSSKLPKNSVIYWQIYDDHKWRPLGRQSSEQIERGYHKSKDENVYILDDDCEHPGDQVLYCGDLAMRLGGPLVYRNKTTMQVCPMRRILVRYVLASPNESKIEMTPTIAPLVDCDIPGKPSYTPSFELATTTDDPEHIVLLNGDTVSAILTAQYGSPDVQPLGPDDPPISFVDVTDSLGRRLNLISSGMNVAELTATDPTQPNQRVLGKFIRHEVVVDGTYHTSRRTV